jgi:hypothetical protein
MSAAAGTTDNAEKLLALLGSSATSITEPVVLTESGKAGQPNKTGPCSLLLVLKGKSGASKIQVGPTEKVEGYEVPVEIPASTQQTVTLRLPTGWWVKTTMAEGSIAKAIVTPL